MDLEDDLDTKSFVSKFIQSIIMKSLSLSQL
jgi:hypothetical protein